MIACPNCRRRIITANDMLAASLDGAVKCRACGKLARLDMLSRWVIACLLAIVLPMVLLYLNVFYSGHLFIVSIAVMLGAWRLLSAIGLPLLNLELVPRATCLNPRQSMLTIAAIVGAALIMDGFMAHRIDADAAQDARSAATESKPR